MRMEDYLQVSISKRADSLLSCYQLSQVPGVGKLKQLPCKTRNLNKTLM